MDTEGPTVIVTNPSPGAWIQTAIELQALITDPHFESWEARIAPDPPQPGSWTVFAAGNRPSTDPDNVLARWSTTNLPEGGYVVEVEATDRAGNRTVSDPIPIANFSPQLIASFDADPIYFSPNGDGIAETTDFRFELLREAIVNLTDEVNVELIEDQLLSPAVLHTASWDGLGVDHDPVPDGAYSLVLEAWESSTWTTETDNATVIVDRAAPDVVISSPHNDSLTALPVTISGLTDDLHADHYDVVLHYPDGSTSELAAGSGNWSPTDEFTLHESDRRPVSGHRHRDGSRHERDHRRT